MAKFSFDEKEVTEALLQLPFGTPGGLNAHHAMMQPGNCVKSKEMAKGSPKYMGRIVQYADGGTVLLVSHCDVISGGNWIWKGTNREYFSRWLCD